MTTDQIVTKIIQNSYLLPDIRRRMTYIRLYLEYHFFSSSEGDIQTFLERYQAPHEDVQTLSSLKSDFWGSFTKDHLYDTLNEISQKIDALPVVTVYLAIMPELTDINQLGRWFREHLSPVIIIDLKTNPSLLGGCAYVWKGVYKEFSIHYFLHKNADEIAKIISSFAAKKTPSNKPNDNTLESQLATGAT